MDQIGGVEITLIDEECEILGRNRFPKAGTYLLEGEDAVRALERLMDCGEKTRGFDWNRGSAPRTAVWELRVTELSAKANLLPD